MLNTSTFISSKLHRSHPKKYKKAYHKQPTPAQIALRDKVATIARAYRGRSSSALNEKLSELGLLQMEKRIYKNGGVGTWQWMPKFGVYRIQIRASHISTKCVYMPYAQCVEV